MNMPRDRDDESGQFTATVTDDQITSLLAEQNGAGTGEVADVFGIQQPSAYRRLKQLEEADRVESRKIGGSLLWTATHDGAGGVVESDPEPTESLSESGVEDVGGPVGALDLAPNQQAAVAAMRDYLREHGAARKADFTNDVYPEHPAGYESANGWWNALGTGGTTAESRGALADLDSVEKPERGPTWRWVGK